MLQWIEENVILVSCLAAVVFLLLLGLIIWGCRMSNKKAVKKGQPTRMQRLKRAVSRSSMSASSQPAQSSSSKEQLKPRTSDAPKPKSGSPKAGFIAVDSKNSYEMKENKSGKVRCPMCDKRFASDAEVSRHLDKDHA